MGHDAARAAEEVGAALPVSLLTLQAVKTAAGVAGVLGATTGAILLLAPRRYFAPDAPLRRWLLETDLGGVLNNRYSIERRVYRKHRLVGALVVAGGAAMLALLVFLALDPRSMPLRTALGRLGFRFGMGVAAAIALALLVVGICLVLRPSVLKGVEAVANRWIEPKASRQHLAFSEAILRAPRLSGALLLVAALFCVWPF